MEISKYIQSVAFAFLLAGWAFGAAESAVESSLALSLPTPPEASTPHSAVRGAFDDAVSAVVPRVATPQLQVAPSLTMGGRLVDSGAGFPRRLVLTNTGSETLLFEDPGVAINGTNSSDFQLDHSTVPTTLDPGSSAEVLIRFAPSALGSRTAEVTITTNDPVSPYVSVALTGTGLDAIPIKAYDGQGPGISRVGPGGEYASLNAVAAAVNYTTLNGGDWTFQITGNLVETFMMGLTVDTNDYGIYFRPAPGTQPIVDFTNPDRFANIYIVGIGASREMRNIVFDGCAVEGGTTRDMTIRNAAQATSGCVITIYSYTENIQLRNLNVVGRSTATAASSGAGALFIGGFGTNADPDGISYPTNTLVENCLLSNTPSPQSNGVLMGGMRSSGGKVVDCITGLTIRDCEIVSVARGLVSSSCRGILLERNIFSVTQTNGGYNCFAIQLSAGSEPSTDDVTIDILHNEFRQVQSPVNFSTIELGAIFLDFIGERHTYNIVNNTIGPVRLTGNGSASRLTGILVARAGNQTVNILHNSIHIAPSATAYPALTAGTCYGIGNTNSGFTGAFNVRNNLVVNEQPNGSALNITSNVATVTSDYNGLYAASGITGRKAGVDQQGVDNWYAATGFDEHSHSHHPKVAASPGAGRWASDFATTRDYHFSGNPGPDYEAPIVLPLLTSIDIDGESRGSVVTMGPDEPADSDGDGSPSLIEDRAANTGDGNDDGIADRLQGNVCTILLDTGSNLMTFVTDAGTFTGAAIVDSPPQDDGPVLVAQDGLVRFNLAGLETGGHAVVGFPLPINALFSQYAMYVEPPSTPTPRWDLFLFNGETGARLDGTNVSLDLEDGGRGDGDFQSNGLITHAGARATFTAECWMLQ